MARRFTRGKFVRPSPRTKMWIGSGVGQTVIVANSKHLVGSLSAGALLLRPFTILRTRMLLTYESDQIAASEVSFGTYGQIVVTDAASAIGVTAIPDPDTISPGNPEADWFVLQSVYVSFSRGASGVLLAERQYEVDSHSMRKVGPDDDVVEMFSEAGALGAILSTQGRRLIQLH